MWSITVHKDGRRLTWRHRYAWVSLVAEGGENSVIWYVDSRSCLSRSDDDSLILEESAEVGPWWGRDLEVGVGPVTEIEGIDQM